MKKVFLAMAICIAGLTSVKAQTTKGNLFLGTDIAGSSYSWGNATTDNSNGNNQTQNEKKYGISLTPEVGVFLTDHLVFGGSLDFDYSHDKNNITNTNDAPLASLTTNNTTAYSVGPFLRYYFFNTTPSKTLFYVQGLATVGSGTGSTIKNDTYSSSSSVYTGNDNSIFLFKGNAEVGLTHFIDKNIGLDVALGYLYSYEKLSTSFSNDPIGGTSSSGTIKATMPENRLTLSAGFHLFLP